MASPVRPLPLKSMARTTSPVPGVGKIGRVGEAAVAQAREQAEGVRARVERDERGKTTGRERPDGDARGSLQARDRRRVSRPGDAVRPWAGAIEHGGSERSPAEVLERRRPRPRACWCRRCRAGRPAGDRPPRCPKRRARPGRSTGGRNQPCPSPGKTEIVPSPALRTIRSVMPLPSKSAERIWAGSEPVASLATRTKPVDRRTKNEIALSSASTLAISRAVLSRHEGDVARRVARVDRDRGREAAGLARPARAIEDVAGRIDDRNIGAPSPLMSATRGVSRRTRSTTDGSEKVPSPLLSRTCTSSGLVRVIARSVWPLPAKSPVTMAVEYRRSTERVRTSGPGTCRRRCPGKRSSRRSRAVAISAVARSRMPLFVKSPATIATG